MHECIVMTTNNHENKQLGFLFLIAGSDEVIVVSPDGVQRHHDEKRVSPLDDPE